MEEKWQEIQEKISKKNYESLLSPQKIIYTLPAKNLYERKNKRNRRGSRVFIEEGIKIFFKKKEKIHIW